MIRSAFQLVLDLFGSETPRATSLQSGPIHSASSPGTDAGTSGVPIIFSKRRKRGWRLVKEEGKWICQAPHALRQAPPEIQADLQNWIHSALHPFPGSRKRRKESERKIFAWMSPRVLDRVPHGSSMGEALDLQQLFQDLNEAHFKMALEATVRWSPRMGGLSTHQELRTSEGVRHLITISRGYDGKDVPRVAVEGVLFHEMCHIAAPPRQGRGGKRMIHHKEFRMAERQFPGWSQWHLWEKTHLARRVRNLS